LSDYDYEDMMDDPPMPPVVGANSFSDESRCRWRAWEPVTVDDASNSDSSDNCSHDGPER